VEWLWIIFVMAGMIVGSWIIELILPMKVKERLGAMISWSMMAVTMTFLGLCTVLLIYVIATQAIPYLLGA
jgi:hypothetical protein